MYSPTQRLFAVLEMLQSHGSITGPEIAERLEVDVRSVRRYITTLRDLGIPVDSDNGRYGGYMLRPGFRLPPLMFNEPEILSIILGLVTVQQLGLATAPGIVSAAAKIERVLPDELRERARALQEVLMLNLPSATTTAHEVLAAFSLSAYHRLQLQISYQNATGKHTNRVIDVYGLVFHGGAWYAPAYCHLREDLRVFRLDRVHDSHLLDASFEMPTRFNALEYVLNSLATMPDFWHVEVLLKTSLERVQQFIPRDIALLTDTPEGVILNCYTPNLAWIVAELARIRTEIIIHEPEELRDAFREFGERMIDLAQQKSAS